MSNCRVAIYFWKGFLNKTFFIFHTEWFWTRRSKRREWFYRLRRTSTGPCWTGWFFEKNIILKYCFNKLIIIFIEWCVRYCLFYLSLVDIRPVSAKKCCPKLSYKYVCQYSPETEQLVHVLKWPKMAKTNLNNKSRDPLH